MNNKPSTPSEEPLDEVVKIYLNPPRDRGAVKPKLPPHPPKKEEGILSNEEERGDSSKKPTKTAIEEVNSDFEITVGPPEEQSATEVRKKIDDVTKPKTLVSPHKKSLESTVEDDDILELTEVVEGDLPEESVENPSKKEGGILEEVAGKKDLSKESNKTAIEGVDDTGDQELIEEFERITAKIMIPEQLDSKNEETSEAAAEDDDIDDIDITVGPPEKRFQPSFPGSLESQLAELDEEVMDKLRSEIRGFRMLGRDIMAKVVEVTDIEGIGKAVYLVLKKKEGDLLVFAGKYGKHVEEDEIDFLLNDIDNEASFKEKGKEIKEAIGEKVEKFKKELITIGGKLIKFRISENNLFAIIEITEEKTPAESKAIRDAFKENDEIIEVIENLKEGTYYVLKKGDAGLFIFAGKEYGHKLSVPEKEKQFSTIDDTNSFIEQSKIEKEKFDKNK